MTTFLLIHKYSLSRFLIQIDFWEVLEGCDLDGSQVVIQYNTTIEYACGHKCLVWRNCESFEAQADALRLVAGDHLSGCRRINIYLALQGGVPDQQA